LASVIRHRWNLSPRQAVALQRRLAGLVQIRPLPGPVRTIAGVDCALLKEHTIVAAAVLCDARTLEVTAAAGAVRPCRFPYVPGLLSFREAPAIIAAVGRLPGRADLLMCDGQGLAHPRRLGLAAHVGLLLGLPTIGVAKSRLCGRHGPVGRRRGSRTPLRHEGQVIGSAVRTRSAVRCLYVSVGNRIRLDEVVRWVVRCARRYRLPEPTRQAHILVNALVRRLQGGMPCGQLPAAIQSALADGGRRRK
jgi:deoxyribonuclease V